MQTIKNTTQKAAAIVSDWRRARARDIFDAYARPSTAKIRAWRGIVERAAATAGYNNDLHISGTSSNFFSTVYSYTDGDGQHIIKDTYADTYEVII